MNSRTLVYLCVAVVALGLLYAFVVPAWEEEGALAERKLFAGVDGQSIEKITIEQRDEKVELEFKDGAWRLPIRNGYPADNSKIRALLLKIFDLTVSQEVPGGETSLDGLGLSDEALKRGFTKISFFDSAGKPISGIRLGEARKSKDRSPTAALSGQYIRKEGENTVYLLGSPVSANPSPASWLELNLVNVLPSSIYSITQVRSTADKQEVEFELLRPEASPEVPLPPLSLRGGVPEGKALQDPVVTQIRAGLENVRLTDVSLPTAEAVKNLTFDYLSLYKTVNGLSYRVESAAGEGERFYVKLSVSFDTQLAEQLKQEHEKAAAQPSADLSASPVASPVAGASSVASPVPTPKKKPELTLSSAEEAEKLNKQLSQWIFELPGHQARKLRYSKKELLEPPAPPPQSERAPQPGGAPQLAPGALQGMPFPGGGAHP